MLKLSTERLAPYVPVLLRVVVGITFLAHGLQKLQHPAFFIGFVGLLKVPFAPVSSWFIILLETVGSLLLILGLGTRWLGILFAVEMAVTILLVKRPFIAPPGTGGMSYEQDLLLLATSLALVLLGSGPFSIDQNVLKRVRVPKSGELSFPGGREKDT